MIKNVIEAGDFIQNLIYEENSTINEEFKNDLERAYLLYKIEMDDKGKEFLNSLCIKVTGEHIDKLFYKYFSSFDYENENKFFKIFLNDYLVNHTDELIEEQFDSFKSFPDEFIKERLITLGCFSKFKDIKDDKVSLKEVLICELLEIYTDTVVSYDEIKNECFEKYNGIEAVYKVCEKKPEYLKVKTEALKLIYQIYKDINNEEE